MTEKLAYVDVYRYATICTETQNIACTAMAFGIEEEFFYTKVNNNSDSNYVHRSPITCQLFRCVWVLEREKSACCIVNLWDRGYALVSHRVTVFCGQTSSSWSRNSETDFLDIVEQLQAKIQEEASKIGINFSQRTRAFFRCISISHLNCFLNNLGYFTKRQTERSPVRFFPLWITLELVFWKCFCVFFFFTKALNSNEK